MNIYVNGETKTVPEGFTAEQLVELLALKGRRLAMEVNQEIVPRSTFANHIFQPEDAVEIVHAVGGG